ALTPVSVARDGFRRRPLHTASMTAPRATTEPRAQASTASSRRSRAPPRALPLSTRSPSSTEIGPRTRTRTAASVGTVRFPKGGDARLATSQAKEIDMGLVQANDTMLWVEERGEGPAVLF